MNIKIVSRILSRVITMATIAMIVCIVLALHYHEPVLTFVWSGLISGSLALVIYLLSYGKKTVTIGKREAYISVTCSWFVISLIGTLPYLFSGFLPDFADAFFESVSGFSTTGSSVINNIEALPKSLLFWRSLTHWIGGIGIIMLVIVVSPSLKMGTYSLFSLESSLQEKIRPKLKAMGNRLLVIYLLLTLAETLMLVAGKMSWFDSICHSFATVATGGFSTQNASIANYSPYIQYVIAFFMLLAGTNFIIHYYLFIRRIDQIKKNQEFRFYFKVTFLLGLIVAGSLYFQTPRSLELAFRDAIFQTISMITCTGFATSDYLHWPKLAMALIFGMLFIGGSTGSTAGGIKMARHLVAYRSTKRALTQVIHPYGIFAVKLNNKVVDGDDRQSIHTFIVMYLMMFALGSVLLVFLGNDGATATSSIATAMGGIGPGFGTVGPMSNFHHLSDLSKYLLTLFMLMGRLEIYAFLMIFTPFFWKR